MASVHRTVPRPVAARVLIVDDDERNAFAATEALKVLGHELVVARSGEEALRLLLDQEFAVILLDLHMPGMDGYETARLIREHPRTRDTPIVFVTAVFRDEAHIFQAYSVGAVDVVFKPVDPFILRSKVSILADLHIKTLEVRRQAEEQRALLEENARINEGKLAAEMALRAARERQDSILRSLPVVFTSRASVHPFAALFVSDSITPLTGFEPSRFVDEPEIGLGRIHPDDVQGVVDCLMRAADTGAYACEYRWRCADGQYRTFLDQGVWVDNEELGGGQILGTLLDVTERRQLEEQLTQARKMEAVGQLTGGVAHDFNNLLTVVLGNTDILLRRMGEQEGLTKHLAAIRAATERGQSLTRQLLAFSRRQQLNPQAVDLNRLIREFTPLVRQAVGEGVRMELDLTSEPLHAWVDPTHLETALLNLAVNARDAMEGEGRLLIRTRRTDAEEGEGLGQITVTDTGAGIPSDVAARIFEPFYTTKEVGRGSGLGLSQVYGFVTQSGGRVDVQSTPGKGAVFVLELPLTEHEPVGGAASPATSEPATGSERILIVEDDPAVLSVCLDMLKGLGYDCEVAVDADGALNRLEADRGYDLLFSDVVMPGGRNGIQLARRAKELHPDLRVLLTSGYVGRNASSGPPEFPLIDKPYERSDLASRIRQVLDEAPPAAADAGGAGQDEVRTSA